MIDFIIFDLYLYRTELYSLENQMSEYAPDAWPSNLFDHVLEANDQFYHYWAQAEKTLGSYDEVNKQLSLLDKRIGVA